MAVFPDRIVLKNSTDGEAAIIAAIETGGTDEITQGEIVLGLTPSAVKFYTKSGNGNIVSLGGTGVGATSLVELSDVDLTTVPPVNGDVLAYDSGTGLWTAQTPTDVTSLADLGDVNFPTPPTDGQYLRYSTSTSTWGAADFEISFDTSPQLGGDLQTAGNLIANAAGAVSVEGLGGEFIVRGKTDTNSEGKITLNCSQNNHGVTLQSPPHSAAATYTLTLPTTVGTAGQALITTNGSGQLEWSTVSGSGTVTSVDGVGQNGITVTGGPITGAGTLNVALDNQAITPGSFKAAEIFVNGQGIITGIFSGETELTNLKDVNLILPSDGQVLAYNSGTGDWENQTIGGTGTVTSVDATGSGGISVTGGPITGSGVLDIQLDTTGVTAGSYVNPSFTVDAEGRLTAATSGSTPMVDPMTTEGDMVIQFSGVPARLGIGSEGQALTVSSGYPTWVDLGTGGTVTSVDITPGTGISATGGPITNSGSITVGLVNSGVQPGTYTNTQLTVDNTGRITAASDGTVGIPDAPNDGLQYGRQNQAWTQITGGGGGAVDSVNGETGVVVFDRVVGGTFGSGL